MGGRVLDAGDGYLFPDLIEGSLIIIDVVRVFQNVGKVRPRIDDPLGLVRDLGAGLAVADVVLVSCWMADSRIVQAFFLSGLFALVRDVLVQVQVGAVVARPFQQRRQARVQLGQFVPGEFLAVDLNALEGRPGGLFLQFRVQAFDITKILPTQKFLSLLIDGLLVKQLLLLAIQVLRSLLALLWAGVEVGSFSVGGRLVHFLRGDRAVAGLRLLVLVEDHPRGVVCLLIDQMSIFRFLSAVRGFVDIGLRLDHGLVCSQRKGWQECKETGG